MKTLIIVDLQKDFIDGSLPVPNAAEAIDHILQIIPNYDHIILTLDWHSMNDSSFKENGGQWPMHCVKASEGATVPPLVLKTILVNKVPYEVFLKGTNPNIEEYGAFHTIAYDYGMSVNHESEVYLDIDAEYDICGLAGDYCVHETYKNLKKAGYHVNPLYDCMGWIGEPYKY